MEQANPQSESGSTQLNEFSTNIIQQVTKIVYNKFNAFHQKIQNNTDMPKKIEENCNSYKTALLSNIAVQTQTITQGN